MATPDTSQLLDLRTTRPQLGAPPLLRNAALLFLAGFLLHNADHLRRGVEILTPEVFWAGVVSGVISLAAIALVLARHRLSGPVAAGVGFAMAIGVSVVHLPPRWSAFSDSLPDGGVDAFTWFAVLCEIAGAFALGWTGQRALRKVTVRPDDRPS